MNIDAVFALVALLALGFIFYGPWQEVCTAWARQVAFEKRDAIFDMAVAGELDIRSPEYRAIRKSIENLIRFAHELTLLNFLVVHWYLAKNPPARAKSRLYGATSAIRDANAKKKVMALVQDVHVAMTLMMIAKSPFTIPILVVFIALKRIGSSLPRKVREYTAPLGEMIQVEAESAPVNHYRPIGRAA